MNNKGYTEKIEKTLIENYNGFGLTISEVARISEVSSRTATVILLRLELEGKATSKEEGRSILYKPMEALTT
tara:strand:- start:1235 stop:1450 length:216 start_codon:yes stop_codon:yes gene_type:complete